MDDQLVKFDLIYGIHRGIRGIVSIVEVILDIDTLVALWGVYNLFEFGLFIGKGSVNMCYFGFGIYIAYLYYTEGHHLDETEKEEYGLTDSELEQEDDLVVEETA